MAKSRQRHASLTAELEAALVRELVHEWHNLSWAHFHDVMVVPTFALTDVKSLLARWVKSTRTIEFSRNMVLAEPWGVLVEVLKHEMAHQFVAEVLNVHDEPPHGPAFQRTCERLSIDASACGVPTKGPDDGGQQDRILEKVSRLLALAESSNQHEAEAAMAAAQRLLLRHNLEHRQRNHGRGYSFRHLGTPTGRVAEHQRLLGTILVRHFFVEGVWVSSYLPLEGRRGSSLEVCGTPTNLEIASYVHDFLLQTAERLWSEHRRREGITSDRDRRTFFAGVMSGFDAKLSRDAMQHREQGLVWVKDADLQAFYGRRHPRLRTLSYGGGGRAGAFAEGRAAGEQIILHRGVAGAATDQGHLLPGKRS